MAEPKRRTLLVTGASSGVGSFIAREAAKLGWKVAIGARRRDRLEEVAEELRALGAEVFAGSLDVSDARSVDDFFDGCEAALGLADAIVNNAGHSWPRLMHEYPPEQLRSEVETNLLGSMFVTRRALRALLGEQRRGDIVFISSDSVRNPRPGQLAYGATKAALENLADGLSKELEGTGIRVTKIRLGPALSEFGFAWDADTHEQARAIWQRFGLRDSRLEGSLLPPESVGQTVIYAVSQPPGVLLDTIELQPEVPPQSG
jgi:NAD(P)-dependent dehydrogenase (short-subunit alcohol dehydrogenase family)